MKAVSHDGCRFKQLRKPMNQEHHDTDIKPAILSMLKHKFAYAISNFGNPFILLIFLTAYASFHFMDAHQAVKILLIFLLCSFVPTALFIIINVKRGKFSNYDVSTKAQRPVFYIFAIVLIGFVTLALFFLPYVHPFLRWGAMAAFTLLLSSFLINFWLKCSLHTCFSVYVAIAFMAMRGRTAIEMGLALTVLAVLMGWSRIVLKRHTLSEVITGAFLGSLVGGLFYWYVA